MPDTTLYTCGHCGRQFQAPVGSVGIVACPYCGQSVQLPAPARANVPSGERLSSPGPAARAGLGEAQAAAGPARPSLPRPAFFYDEDQLTICPQARNALVCAVIGMFTVGMIIGPIAVVLGLAARRTILMSPHTYEGGGLAMLAILLGIVAVVAHTLLWGYVMYYVLFP